MNCRFCKTNLTDVLIDLHHSPPSNAFITYQQLNEEEIYYPLIVYICEKCFLVQIDEYKKADEIFNQQYIYFSSFSSTWIKHCEDYAAKVISRFRLNEKSFVIEIASNDGYLLRLFKEKNIPVLGIEPTKGTAEVAISRGINTILEFFGESCARKLSTENKKADLVIGNNVLAHVPDINSFVRGLKMILKEKGVITMEFPHLLRLLQDCQFDTIYHEHFSYLSFTTVEKIFAEHDLSIFDVEEIPTHGGSLRIYAQHNEYASERGTEARVNLLKEKEKSGGITERNYYDTFQKRADKVKHELLNFLIGKKMKGVKIAAYGAAAKGNTLLNYCGIKNDLIDFAADISPYKQGKYLPGSHIPVVHEDELRIQKPEYILILPWNIQNEIMEQLAYVKEWKAKFVIAIPELKVIHA